MVHEETQSIIIVKHLTKVFKKQQGSKNFKQIVIDLFGRKTRKKTVKKQFVALDDVSFEVKKGEFFGIVGRNGSGKSTLLKILAGVYVPTRGRVGISGSLTPFIELGVGFNPELSGKDNVYLNSALLGFTRRETDAMYDEIVEFSELSDFMDEKLRNYSSGMQVRLAFSIAIKAKSEILLIDEVLAVGDTAFQHKCLNYFKRIKREGRTVVFVTHDMSSVERFCDRVLVLDKSKFLGIFKPKEATKIYQRLNAESELASSSEEYSKGGDGTRPTIRIAEGLITSLRIGDGKKAIVCGEPLRAKISLNPEHYAGRNLKGLIAMSFYDGSGQYVASLDSNTYMYDGKSRTVTMELASSPFVSGVYTAYLSIYQQQPDGEYIAVDGYDSGCKFSTIPPHGGDGSGQLFLHGSTWK